MAWREKDFYSAKLQNCGTAPDYEIVQCGQPAMAVANVQCRT